MTKKADREKRAARNAALQMLTSKHQGRARNAVKMETIKCAHGVPCDAKPGSLPYIARQLLIRSGIADELAAAFKRRQDKGETRS